MGELVEMPEGAGGFEIIEIPKPTGQYPRRVLMDARQVFNQDGPYIAAKMMKLFRERLDNEDPEIAMEAIEKFAPWRKHFFKEQPQETLNVQAKLGEVSGNALSDINARLEALRGLSGAGSNQLPNGSSGARIAVAQNPRLDPAREVRVSPAPERTGHIFLGPRVNPTAGSGI